MRYFGKKILLLLTTFCFAGQAFGANPSLPDTTISSVTYYKIQSCSDLNAFATSVNSGSTKINGILMASFDCGYAEDAVAPIGKSSSYSYQGKFDGNGFTIKNLKYGTEPYNSTLLYAGLFGYVGNATITDVYVEGIQAYAKNAGGSYAGGIAAYLSGGSITNCVVKDALIYAAKSGSKNASHSGGIVGGIANKASVKLCNVDGKSYVEATTDVGGIVGNVASGCIVENCLCGGDVMSVAISADGYAGGIVGANSGTISRCVYTGDFVQPGTAGGSLGGAIVGSGTYCADMCYYTYEGLKVGGKEEYNGDIEDIKNTLGEPWDTMVDEGDNVLILNPRNEDGAPATEMYYDVTFHLSGKGPEFTRTSGKDRRVAEPEMIVIDGQGVEGWYKDANFVELWNFSTDVVLERGLILYAKWATAYKITFDVNGGTWPSNAVTEKYVTIGKNITADGISIPQKSGYKFLGWNLTSNASASGDLGSASENKTVFAVWEQTNQTITITYSKDGVYCAVNICENVKAGPGAAGQKTYGEPFTLSEVKYTTSSKTNSKNFVQAGWSLSNTRPRKDYELGGIYTKDEPVTLYPYFVASSSTSETYTVTYKPNGGTGSVSSQTKTQFKDLTLASGGFERSGYVLDGWTTSTTGSKMYDLGGLYKTDGNITLYAHWVEKFTVTFMNGENVYDEVSVVKNGKISMPTNPLDPKKVFKGWYKEPSFTNEFKFTISGTSVESINANMTLYAKFKQTSFFVKIEVVGNAITPQAETIGHLPGSTITLTVPVIPDQHKQSTVFDHWEVVKGGVTITDNSFTMPEADVELKAHFIEKPAIKYSCGSMEACVGDDVTEYKNFKASYTIKNGLFTRDGFTQSGWATEENGDMEYAFGSVYSTDKDLSLYPFFTKQLTITLSEDPEITVTITLDNNDDADSVTAKVSEAYETLDPKPADPTKESSDKYDYTFKEFDCSVSGVEYTCEAKFDSTGRIFDVAVNLPEGASLVCSEGADGAENCSADGKSIKHQYDVETTPLPDAVMMDALGIIDESWTFEGWFDNKDGLEDGSLEGGAGKKITSISAESIGDTAIYPYFTKTIEIVVPDVTPTQTISVVIDNNDDADSVSAKIDAAWALLEDPKPTPTKESSDKYDYTFKKFDCSVSDVGYTCDAKFDSTGRIFDVAVNLPEGASLVCTEGADGAENCTDDGKSIKYQYGEGASTLPDADMEGWTFEGWFDNKDGFEDGSLEGGAGKKITSISAESFGDTAIYPFFTKEFVITLSKDPEVKVTITLDNNDDADSVSKKVNEAYAALDPKPTDPTKTDPDGKVTYEFDEFTCTVNAGEYTCQASFNSTNATYTITYNLLNGESSSANYTYSETEDFTLATDIEVTGWTFSAWYADAEHAGDAVAKIVKGDFGNKVFYGLYTQVISVTIGENTFSVTIDSDDDEDSINAKILAEARKQGIEDPTKTDSDGKITYEFEKYNCTAGASGYTCENVFKETYTIYTVAVNLPEGASLVCTEGAASAANCSADGKSIKHQYDVETTPLPNADMEGWAFEGWFDNKDGIADGSLEGGAGKKITSISAESFGDTAIYPYFTKTIEIVVPDVTPTQTISVVIDNNDDADSVSAKVNEVYAALEPKPADPTKESSDKYDYTFKEFDCSVSGVEYTCEAKFDSTGRVFEVAFNLPEGATLVSPLDSYTYGNGVTLPEAQLEGWTFDRWVDGTGNTVSAIGNEEFGDKSFTPVFKKNIEVVIGDVTLEVEILYTDTDEQIQEKIIAAMAAHDPKIDTPTKEETDTHTFTFDKFVVNEDGKYVPSFNSTGRVFEVAFNLPEGATLVSPLDSYTYGNGVTLPEAQLESWTFDRWVDGTGNTVSAIGNEEFGDKSFTPVFKKNIEVVIGDVTLEVEILYTDTDEQIQEKIAAAMAAHDPKIDTPTKEDSDTHTFTFDKFVVNEDGKYVPAFDSTGRVFEVAFNLPEGATLVSPLDSYTYGNGVTLPEAQLEGWTFDRWVDGTGNTVSAIGNEEFGDKSFTPVFKKNIEVVIGDVTLEVEILYTDTDEQIQEKIAAAMAAHDPKIDTPTKEETDTHTFTFDKFVVNEDGKYVPSFNSTGRIFDVAVNLPEGASLVCSEGAAGAENCSADGKSIKHQYDVETTPLPGAVMTDAEGKVDESWTFAGWFDNKDGIADGSMEGGAGKKITTISAESFGDTAIYPYFTKTIKAVIGEDTLEIVIDNNDTQDSINAMVTEAAKNHVPEIKPDPTHYEDAPYIFDFAGYECKLVEGEYVCEAIYDATGMTYEVVTNLGSDMKLVCEGEAAAACNEKGDAVEHTYGTKTSPLPSVVVIGKNGQVDESWKFKGWFDNADGISDSSMKDGTGKMIFEIAAERYGDIEIYPYFAKDVEIVLSEVPEVKVTITVDNNDNADSVTAKVNEAYALLDPKPATPTKDKDDKFEYVFRGYECSAEFVCRAAFDGVPYGMEIVVAYGDGADDTIHVTVMNDDDAVAISKKIEKAMADHDPVIPTPTKRDDPMYTYDFHKFEKNPKTGIYEPTFSATPKTYRVTFNMPSAAKLEKSFEGYVIGEQASLPVASLKGWEFKGWYTEEKGLGSRVKFILATDIGDKEFFAFFQKTISYDVNGNKGEIVVTYEENVERTINRALNGVAPETIKKDGADLMLDKWVLEDGVYVPKYKDSDSFSKGNVPHFSVIAVGRTLEITGAKLGAKIAVFDLRGRLVKEGSVENATQLVELATPGSYIVRVNNQASRVNVR